MLLNFRFGNFRSFPSEQELSLVASSHRDQLASVRPIDKMKTGGLCVAAIFGANASGKSNVLAALQYMADAIRHSHRSWKPDGPIRTDPFRLDPTALQRESSFACDLVLNGVRYEYQFVLNSQEIIRESLYAYPTGRPQMWYARSAGEKPSIIFGKHLGGERRSIESVTRRNSLFLSAAAQNNHEQLTPIYQWFADKLVTAKTVSGYVIDDVLLALCNDQASKARVVELLASADLGLMDLNVVEEQIPERALLFQKKLQELVQQEMGTEVAADFPLGRTTNSTLVLIHRSKTAQGVPFHLASESAGTLRWLYLLGPVLSTLKAGGTLCIDDLNSSLHPLLSVQLAKLFNDPKQNPHNAQLIFNSHETNILEHGGLRRDQVWFVEKDREGASHLYPLTDFKPRKSENLERGYLQGRYGGIPFLSDPTTLDEDNQPEQVR